MNIEVGKLAGFCPGVSMAVESARKELKNGKIYCLGELVHNKQVVEELENNGMITVQKIEEIPNNSKVIFRAHGEAKSIYEEAKNEKLEVLDLTCGNVKSIHKKVEREKQNSFIIIIGKKNHPEVIGTKGFAGTNSYVVETEDDILDAYIQYENTNLKSVYIVAQTTFSSLYFDKLAKEIEYNFAETDVIIDKTICFATEKRQEETSEMSKKFHNMIIIGGKNSSNTIELVKLAEKNCSKVYHIQTVENLKEIDFSNIENLGIMAGASTPKNIVESVKKYLMKV